MLVVLILCIILATNCFANAAPPVIAKSEMYFKTAEWAYEVRDEADYDLNPDGEFARGERGYAYLEIANFAVAKEDNFYYLQLSVDVALQSKRGLTLFSQKDVLELEEWYLDPPESTWFYVYVDIPSWAPKGLYKTVITIHDTIIGESLVEVREIMVK